MQTLLDGRIHLFGCAFGIGHKDLVETHSAAALPVVARMISQELWNSKFVLTLLEDDEGLLSKH